MIQTIQLIKFFYPFIILAVFFCLYKKEYSINRRFCWCMTMYFNARRLFAFLTVGLLIFMNWCCYVTNPNYAVLFSAVITCCLFSYRVADAALHRLHERTRLWALTLMLALICYSIPYMYSIFLVLYTVGVASVFYPSERVLRIRNEANSICNPPELLQRIIRNYY